MPISTSELARQLYVLPTTIRSALYQAGSYHGQQPVGRTPSGRLLWADDAAEQINEKFFADRAAKDAAKMAGAPGKKFFHKGAERLEKRVVSTPRDDLTQ